MFGRRYCNFHEMNQMLIILIAIFIASVQIQQNSVSANEQQQAEQLGKIELSI